MFILLGWLPLSYYHGGVRGQAIERHILARNPGDGTAPKRAGLEHRTLCSSVFTMVTLVIFNPGDTEELRATVAGLYDGSNWRSPDENALMMHTRQ